MKKMITASLAAITLAISCSALAQPANNSNARVVKNCPHDRSKESIWGTFWAPHLRVNNDTTHNVVVYANETAMTLYPDDTVDYFYPFTTWGPQPVIIRDNSNDATVIFNDEVPNETYLHITAKEFNGKTNFQIFPEPMH
jgi:hypothetical protein